MSRTVLPEHPIIFIDSSFAFFGISSIVVEKKLFEIPGDFSEYFVEEFFRFGRVFGFGVDTDKRFSSGWSD